MTTVKFSETNAGGQARSPGAVAYACARLRLRCFPLLPGTKRPALKGWKELATTDLDQVQEWWTGEFTGCGVGIATGAASDLFVVDVDRKAGVDGFKTLQALMREHGSPADLFADTIVVATPSGGCHIYARWAPGIVNSVGELGAGIDIRGAGGLVRAPGWDGLQIVPRGGIRRTGIMTAPAWLVELCRKPPRRPAEGGADESNGGGRVMGTRRTLEALYAAPVGSRNHELNRAAFRLGVRGELTRDAAWAQCQRVLVAMGAGDGMNDWLRTFESGWRNGVAKRGTEA